MVFQMDLNWNEILVNGPGMVAYAFTPTLWRQRRQISVSYRPTSSTYFQVNQSYIVSLAVPKDPG